MKTKILLLLTIVTFLSACETNDNPNINITNADLIGIWDVTELNLDSKSSATINGITVNSKTTGYGKDFDITYVFSENPNIASVSGSYTSVTTTSVTGQQDIVQEISVSSIDGFDEGSWSLNGSSITIIDPNGQSSDAEIIEFSGNKLILKILFDESQDINGISINVSGEGVLTLEK